MADERLSLRNHGAFISYSELLGHPVAPSFLTATMRRYGREAMFVRLAVLAANMANEGLLSPERNPFKRVFGGVLSPEEWEPLGAANAARTGAVDGRLRDGRPPSWERSALHVALGR